MKWDSKDALDKRIVSKAGWFSLSDVDTKAPNRSGVYVFVNSSLQVKYVGKAGAGRLRSEINNAIYRGKGIGATSFGWFATNSDRNALSLENDWIKKYQPINNKRK